jgi:hypothetical protein
MGEAAAPIAAISSLASVGLSAYGKVEQGEGVKAADEMQAAQAERAAEVGRTQADLTDTVYRERLNTTLGNIETIRAAGNVDPSSPTTAAVEDWNRMISDRERMAASGTQREQAATDDASARYLRSAGDFAVRQSYIGAGATVAGGLAGAFRSLGGGGGGGGG